jgi:Kef-type K+ transport system membrane component KefB
VTAPRAQPATPAARLLQALVLLAITGLMLGAGRLLPGVASGEGTIAAVGYLLLAGSIAGSLLELVGVPNLTAYLLTGLVAGPHLLGAVGPAAVADLSPATALALSLIALAGGAELETGSLRRGLRSLAWASLWQHLLVVLLAGMAFAAARPFLPFAADLAGPALLAAALLWGVLAATRSPADTLGILAQTRARGPLAGFTLNFVMTSDVLVLVLLASVVTLVQPLLEPGAELSLEALRHLGFELLGSVALGTTLGLALSIYLRFVGRQLLLVLLALGLVLTRAIDYLRFDWLILFLVAGFVVRNVSRQGDRLLEQIERAGKTIYVVFFASVGARLDLPLVLALWPVAVGLSVARALATVAAGQVASRLAGDPPIVRRLGWTGLVAQSGLALGVAAAGGARLGGEAGAAFTALGVATVALNELVGPVLFKASLDRAGESEGRRPAEAPPAPAVHVS